MSHTSTASSDAAHHRRGLRAIGIAAAGAVVAGLLPGILFSPAGAADPDSVSFTLEGCRNDGTITLPNGSGKFVCPDEVYTSGNLGKGWNELDLVPYRLTSKAGNSAPASQTFTVQYVVDNEDATRPGYDELSAAVLNTSLSDATCKAPTVGSEIVATPGLGGIGKSLYRSFTLTQSANTTCVYDYYARLALGSHLFPGSSLHANLALMKDGSLTTSGIGAKDVSIPVKEISPQELSKTMAASQGSDHMWDITKAPTPAKVSIPNTCDVSGDYAKAAVSVKVTWTKSPATAGGPATIITKVYAKNPASRTITVAATDKIYAGSTQTTLLDTFSTVPADVPANTADFLLGTHTYVWNSPTDTTVNDVATATYTDKVTGVPVPGSTTATASATIQNTGPELNATAVITDSESITGSGLDFAVDSVTGAMGSFTGYTLGDWTTGPVKWTSTSQSDSGSVTFNKTVRAAKGTIEPAGELADTAVVTGSNGFTAKASASTAISVDTRADLTINKSIPSGILTGTETVTFVFDVKDASSTIVASPSITFKAGETALSTVVADLVPGVYTVSERPVTNWGPVLDQKADLSGTKCAGTVNFKNTPAPANVTVSKVTVPAGFESGWSFALYKVGVVDPIATATTSGSSAASLGTITEDGDYYVTETTQSGWTSDGGVKCSFTVDLPADGGKTFACTYTNTYESSITLDKKGDELSKKGDGVTYTLTLKNTSATGGAAGAPKLSCKVTDALIGFDGSVTLGAGETKTWSGLAFTVPSDASDPMINEAKASCTYLGLTTEVAAASASWSTNLFQPKLSLTKTADKQYVQPGEVVTYTVTLENTGSADSPALVPDGTTPFTDTLVPGVTLPSSCDSLAVGEKCSFTYTYTAKAGDTVVDNTASALFHPVGFPNPVPASGSARVTVIHPSFTVTKTCSTPEVPAGQTAIFTVDVANTGDVPLSMVLSDKLGGAPFALTSANTTATATSDVSNAGLSFSAGTVSFTLGVGKKAQLEISITASGTSVANEISAAATLTKAYPGTTYSQTKTATDKCDVVGGATRTIGFWRTHVSFLEQVLDTRPLPSAAVVGTSPLGLTADGAFVNGKICLAGSAAIFRLSSLADVEGVFWASTSHNSDGSKRSALCQAKIITAKQLLGAVLNQTFTNAAPLPTYGGKDLITATVAALAGTDRTLIQTLGGMLDTYNNSGDDVTALIPGSMTIGKADPQEAKAMAHYQAGDC